jgi:hypothetical protein
VDKRERAERKLIEDIWRQVRGLSETSNLIGTDKEWAFYKALLNTNAERTLPVEVLS